jgi:DNA-binding response OmpR family regulator
MTEFKLSWALNSCMGALVVLAEDDAAIRDLVRDRLRQEGFGVRAVSDGMSALRASRERADLLLLDLGLPGIDGLEVARTLRREANALPIVMLTARSDEIDRVIGFEVGADDYVCKPFSPRELMERVKAILRRSGQGASPAEALRFGCLQIDRPSRDVRVRGSSIALTPREYALLVELARNAGVALSRAQLLERVWGFDFEGEERTVDAHVRRLRAKLEEPFSLRFIDTVLRFGYRFRRD